MGMPKHSQTKNPRNKALFPLILACDFCKDIHFTFFVQMFQKYDSNVETNVC